MTAPLLTERFDRALAVAARLHRDQVRKGTTVPYVSHLLGACSIALEFGANEEWRRRRWRDPGGGRPGAVG